MSLIRLVGMKKCPRCNETKTVNEFLIYKGKIGSYCGPCRRSYSKEKYRKQRGLNPEK